MTEAYDDRPELEVPELKAPRGETYERPDQFLPRFIWSMALAPPRGLPPRGRDLWAPAALRVLRPRGSKL